jgi:hypothetical protein
VCSCVRLEATIRSGAPQELSGAVQQRRAYGTLVKAWRSVAVVDAAWRPRSPNR